MTATDLLRLCAGEPPHYQLHINSFVDDFRAASAAERGRMVAAGAARSGRVEGLVAAVVSALCREVAMPAPEWVQRVHSPEPFFVLPARGFALRVRADARVAAAVPLPQRLRPRELPRAGVGASRHLHRSLVATVP